MQHVYLIGTLFAYFHSKFFFFLHIYDEFISQSKVNFIDIMRKIWYYVIWIVETKITIDNSRFIADKMALRAWPKSRHDFF